MRKRVASLVVPMLGLLSATVYASGSSMAGTGTTVPADSGPAGTGAAPAACDAGGAKIGFVLHVRLEITQQIADGAQVAADECNVELDVVGPTAVDAQAAISAFRSEIAAGADGMVVIAFPDQNWNRPL